MTATLAALSRGGIHSEEGRHSLQGLEAPLYYLGRVDFRHPDGPRLAWAGSGFVLRFFGRTLRLSLRSEGENAFRLRLDGQLKVPRLTVNGETSFELALEGPAAEHELECIKLTECFVGTAQLLGIWLPAGRLRPPPSPAARRIEFIGDSITGGFGVLADEYSPYEAYSCDVTQGYAWLTAEALGLEPRISAWSGLGLVRNFDDSPLTWPERYAWVLPGLPEEETLPPWQADLVVVNLGTNDFAGGVIPARDKFVQAYRTLLIMLRTRHPGCRLICCLGPLLNPPARELAQDYLREALQALALPEVYFLEFSPQQPQHGYGVSRHPSQCTHELMAQRLIGFIQGLESARPPLSRPV